MTKLIVYYAHPAQPHSHANKVLAMRAKRVEGLTLVDLYAEYPRFEIDVDKEQQRLLDHEMVMFQFPIFWYSTPSLVKEWQDLVLEHGFAYGQGGDRLSGKKMMLAVTAAGPAEAYTPEGYQHHALRTFLTPLEQTARLSKMEFVPPYVLYGSLKAPQDGRLEGHARGYERLLRAIAENTFDFGRAMQAEFLTCDDLPIREGA